MPEPIKVKLSQEAEEKLVRHLSQQIDALKFGLKPLHETELPKWRRIYEAMPAEQERSFPFQNASNLIVPLAGIHCDTLKARVVSAIWKTRPLWLCNIVGEFDGQGDDAREAWQSYLLHNAVEPTELNLYDVEQEWFGEIIRYGTSFVKSPYERLYEDYMLPAGDGTSRYTPMREMYYKGPKPFKCSFEDIFVNPSARSLESAGFLAHRLRYKKHELMERRYTQFFAADKVDKIKGIPDRTSPHFVQSQREQDMNARTLIDYDYAEWDIYECWLPFRAPTGDKAPRIIVWFHAKTKTILSAVYDFYTPILRTQPFVMGRLLYRDDSLYGYGLCEILESLQEEVSQIHNQRRDNMTIANTRVWRVDPESKLHQGYQIYPSAMLPALAGEIEPLQHGEVASTTLEEEKISMDLAERRSGVSPPMQGMGAGTNSKKGTYSAMGTLSLMQEGNSRTDMTISDIRQAHVKLGRIISYEYANMGLDESKLIQFGKMQEHIKEAAELIRQKKMALPINPSTASVNKEVEKQSDLMLSQIMARHYMSVTQLLQQCAMAVLPPEVKDYSIKVINASDKLMKQILRHFDHDDVDSLVPKSMPQQAQPSQPQGGPQQPNAGNKLAVMQPQQGPSSTPQPRVPASQELFGELVGGGK